MMTRQTDEFKIERLSLDDTAEVASFLNRTWPILYGDTGCPVFTKEYLDWLYGGPDQERHLILGVRSNGSLIALKASLFRRVTDGLKTYSAHISTHLTIDPKLDLRSRAVLAGRLSKFHTLDGTSVDGFGVYSDLSIAFFEKNKMLTRSTKALAGAQSICLAQQDFHQAIVNGHKANTLAQKAEGVVTRPAQVSDMAAVHGLIRRTHSSLYSAASAADAWHHYAKAPNALCLVAERDAKIVGFIATYLLDWVKGGHTTRNAIAEILLGDAPEDLAILLHDALQGAQTLGARGIVLDNVTYLDEVAARQAGIVLIPKEMTLAIRAKSQPCCVNRAFVIDVK